MSRDRNQERLEIFQEQCRGYEIDTIRRCLWDMDYQDTFPEDMCESRTDWDELKDRLSNAHYAVDCLINIIERLLENAPKEETECAAQNATN